MSIFDQIMQAEYDSWGENPPKHEWCSPEKTKQEVDFLKNVLRLSNHHTILDLFCSWGRHTIELVLKGYNVVGLDISPTMIKKAKENARVTHCATKFIRSDFLTSYYTSEFDIIYQIQSSPFEAWRCEEEIIKFLRLVKKALKIDGRYLFGWSDNWNRSDIASIRWRNILKEKGITNYDQNDMPFYYYGIREQTTLVEESGLSLVNSFNNYDYDSSYSETKPGLIMIVKNR